MEKWILVNKFSWGTDLVIYKRHVLMGKMHD